MIPSFLQLRTFASYLLSPSMTSGACKDSKQALNTQIKLHSRMKDGTQMAGARWAASPLHEVIIHMSACQRQSGIVTGTHHVDRCAHARLRRGILPVLQDT